MGLIFLWVMSAYGMTTIIVYGSIFEKLREKIKSRSTFFGKLISCVLCTSTWVGFIMSILLGSLITYFIETNVIFGIFFDGMFTAGSVWVVNAITEFFEENRIK